jgi:3-dehydroquinate dehydratase-2
MAKILLLHGPNLNLLGEREPHIYGRTTQKEIETMVRTRIEAAGHHLLFYQSNHEGQIIDWLHTQRPADFMILNPGALTHTSIALRDAVSAVQVPFVEVHLSNLHKREPFRQHSYLSEVAVGAIMGLGPKAYEYAADYALSHMASVKAKT